MKILPRLLVILATAALIAGAHGQGTVNFNTQISGTSAQVYDDAAHGGFLLGSTNYGLGAQGTNWFAQLYAAAGTGVSSAALVPVGEPVNFRGGFGAGYVQISGTTSLGGKVNTVVTLPFVSPGGPATMQLRVWWGGGTQIASYEAAVASSNPNTRWGASPLLQLAVTGDPTAAPPSVPVDLVELLGFRIGETESFRPPSITTQPQGRLTFVGANILLTVGVNGSPPLSYQWSHNGTNIAGATVSSLALANVQAADSGSYAVVAGNAAGSVGSSNAVLTIVPVPPCAAPPSGLVSWWGGEGNALDYVSGNNGVRQGGVSFTSGVAGQCFAFNGTDSSVKIPASPSLDVGQGDGFTIETWIRPVSVSWQQPIVEWNTGASNNPNPCGVHLWLSANTLSGSGCLGANFVDINKQEHLFGSGPGVVVANAFQHVALTYDKTAGVGAIYLNGVMVARTLLGKFTPQTAYDLYWGLRPAGYAVGTRFQGKMDEVSLYRRALSAGEIQFLYDVGSSGKCKEPPSFVTQPGSLRVNVGTDAQFNVVATGSLTLHYQWFKDGVLLPGETGTSLTLTSVQDAQAGVYAVQVTNCFGSAVSSNALLTVNHAPTVSMLTPIDGTVLVAPASFTLAAEATDDLGVGQVEFWSDTNSLGAVSDAPWYIVQTNLAAGEYHYRAVAEDIMSLATTSAVATVTVLSQPPTESLPLVSSGPLVRQTGLFYQTVRVSNPTARAFAALRLWVKLDSNSVAQGVRVWNATGQSQGVPYVAYNQALAPGQSVELLIEYYVPDRRTLPNPVFRTEVVRAEPPAESEGTLLASVRQVPLPNGLLEVEFSTSEGRIYYVQSSSDMVHWQTVVPAIIGTGGRVQWINGGLGKAESLTASEPRRFYRVMLLP